MSETNTVSPLRQRMIEDMAARRLNPHTQRSHIYSCKRFAAWLKRSPDAAAAPYAVESGEGPPSSPYLATGRGRPQTFSHSERSPSGCLR